MQPNAELHARVLARVRECVQIVNARRPGFAEPQIYYFGNRLAAGLAHFYEHKIGINLQLLERNVEDMLHDTIAHEVAHLVVWHLEYLKLVPRGAHAKHGRHWKGVMRMYFGIEAKRGSNYDISCMNIRRQHRHVYTCACPGKEIKVTTVRHNRIRAGKNYRCVACRTRIVLKEEEIGPIRFQFPAKFMAGTR